MAQKNTDKEKYSKINLIDDEVEEESIFGKTMEFPKIELIGKNKKSKEDYFDQAIRYNPTIQEGLNSLQVEEREIHNLFNKHAKTLSKSYIKIVFDNLFTFFNVLLFTIGIILISIGSFTNCFFLIIVLLNTGIGIFQEIRAKNVIDKLSLMNVSEVKVVRDSSTYRIACDKLVLDDIYHLSTGKEVPADSYIEYGEIEVNESLLTGESLPIKKGVGDYLLAGSFIVSGTCICRVDRIGEHNYVAQLQNKARKVKKVKSILLVSLNRIIKTISVIIIPIGIVSFIKNFGINHQDIGDALTKTFGSLVAMIPSGLFLLISTTLAVSVIALAGRKTMVNDSYAIESLARSNVLCLDKTGTLTDGNMYLEKEVKILDEDIDSIMGDFLSAFEDNNVTSIALAKRYQPKGKYIVKNKLPFSSSRKLSAIEFENKGTYVLGAPEYITDDEKILSAINEYVLQGYRVLLLAHTKNALTEDFKVENLEGIAYFVLSDHIREEAYDTIKWFNENEVEIKIISGDNPLTVAQIAEKVGVLNSQSCISLDGLTDDEVKQAATKYTIFGRVSPEQKAILIKSLKQAGNTVAMTGDGVNDILAMKQANCAIAIASGSEACRCAAHLVLLDSNFASMPKVVEEGRKVINNIQRSATLFLMKTIYAVIIALVCIVTWQPDPLGPSSFYVLEFAVIGIPSFALALQVNTSLIKGNFMKTVLSKSLPGGFALIISVLSIMVMFAFNLFEIDSDIMSTMASLCLSFSGLIILFDKCLPLNWYRAGLFVLMLIFSIVYFMVLGSGVSGLVFDKLNQTHWIIILVVTLFAVIIFKLSDVIINLLLKKHEKTN